MQLQYPSLIAVCGLILNFFLPTDASRQPAEAAVAQPPAENSVNTQAQPSSSNGARVSAPAPASVTETSGLAAEEKERAGDKLEHKAVVPGEKGEGTLLQPWTDHRGRLNEPFLRSLTQRAVSVVIRHPGRISALLSNAVASQYVLRRAFNRFLLKTQGVGRGLFLKS